MYTSIRKLDRLRAGSGSNCGWSTDCLVTRPDTRAFRTNALRTATNSLATWLDTNAKQQDDPKACSGPNLGWSANSLIGLDKNVKQASSARTRTSKVEKPKACSRPNYGWSATSLTEPLQASSTRTSKQDKSKACSGSNRGWSADSLITGPDERKQKSSVQLRGFKQTKLAIVNKLNAVQIALSLIHI